MRMNTELARTIVERFPAMLDSAAGLLRAADGAGLPAREPRWLPETDDDELEPEAETDEAAPKSTGWLGLLETLIPFVAPAIAPAIANAVASGKVQIPGGVGALFDCRRASPKASAAGARTTSTPGATPAPGPRDPAPARRSTPAAREATPNAARASRPEAQHNTSATQKSTTHEAATDAAHAVNAAHAEHAMPAATATATNAATNAAHAADAAHGEHAVPTVTAASATESAAELPTLDSAALAHFAAIQGALTFREGMLARALAAELSPAELRTWLTELRTLSVPDAVAKIREVLGTDGSDNTPGGVS
jgi:hypothetical protein